MMKRAMIAFCALAAMGIVGCGSSQTPDDEAQIRKLIEDARILAEQKNIKELMAMTTKDLVVDPGQKDRQATKVTLFAAFRFYQKFQVKCPRPMVTVDETKRHGEATLPFVIVREGVDFPDLKSLYNDPKSWLTQVGKIADLYHLTVWLTKDDGTWLVRKAHIQGTKRFGEF
jgi:hypothetical protein